MALLRSFMGNLATLLVSLILAVVVWATAVRLSDPVETRLWQIDVQTVGVPADGTLIIAPPNSASITIEGPVSALGELSPADFTGIADLSAAPFGESEVEIRIRESYEDITLLNQFPEVATIRMEQIVTRDLPVVLEVRGQTARGHRAGAPRLEPAFVQVTGVASRVNALSETRVTVFLDDAREDILELRRPTFYDAQGNVASVVGLTVNPDEVEVIIPVVELVGFAEKPVTVIWMGEPAQGFRLLDVRVEPSSVQVTGAPGLIESLRVETEPIDISGLTESDTLQTALALPEGVTLVDIQPIVVTVEIGPILTSDVVQRRVEIRALGEGLEATLDPEIVRVFLFGPLPVLDSLAEDDVRVTIDLLGLDVGSYILEPIVYVAANDVQFRSTQPAAISVLITQTITATNGLTGTIPLTETIPETETTSLPAEAPLAIGVDCGMGLGLPIGCRYYLSNPPVAVLDRRRWLS